MLQIKTIPKNISTIGILLLHPSFIYLTNLARKQLNVNKHTYVTTFPLAKNKHNSFSLTTTKIMAKLSYFDFISGFNDNSVVEEIISESKWNGSVFQTSP